MTIKFLKFSFSALDGFVTYCPTGLLAAGRFRLRDEDESEEEVPPNVDMIISSKGPPGGSVRGERANFSGLVLGCIGQSPASHECSTSRKA